MCGIAGSLWWDQRDDRRAVSRLSDAIIHRGPDAGGLMVSGPMTLAHRRLAIVDCHTAANQPMVDPHSGLIVVFNGEIYNFQDLRQDLERQGAVFQTRSDTEVLLKAFACWGDDAVERFNGMFAFALWDPMRRRLLLARDRLGKKPLFYRLEEGGLVFASELKALRRHPSVPNTINPEAIGQYLSQNYVGGDSCILQGVAKLEPGHALTWEQGRAPDIRSYWDLAAHFRAKGRFRSKAEAAEAVGALIDDAVRLRLVADVPLGAFLSGGLDSAGITEAMGRVGGHGVETFTIGFAEKGYNEVEQARGTAAALGLNHHDETVTGSAAAILPELVRLADEPFADTSMIPVWYLSRFARRSVTVALSGDGGDEIFAGYVTYVADKLHHLGRFIPKPLARAGLWATNSFVPASFGKVSFDYKLRQFLSGHGLGFEDAHLFWRNIFSERDKACLVRPEHRAGVLSRRPGDLGRRHFAAVADCHWLDQASYVDIKTWLPDDILVKVDRMTMAHALEARAPLLDYRLVELAASLPPEWKLAGFDKKHILKTVLRGRLPDAVTKRPKAGFNAPVAHWLVGDLHEMGRAATLSGPLCDWLDRGRIERLWTEHEGRRQDHGFRLFGLVCLGLWLEQHRSMG